MIYIGIAILASPNWFWLEKFGIEASNMAANRVCHFKLVLLGDSAVGKSCLVVRFVRDEFFEFQEPTIGGR